MRTRAAIKFIRPIITGKNCPECDGLLSGATPWLCRYCQTNLYPDYLDHFDTRLIEMLKDLESTNKPKDLQEKIDAWKLILKSE